MGGTRQSAFAGGRRALASCRDVTAKENSNGSGG